MQPYETLFSWKNIALCLVNVVIVIACAVKLLVYGEPIVDMKKCDTSHRLKQTAEQHFTSGDTQPATVNYLRYLRLFGIHLPSASTITWPETITIATWQIARSLLHRVPFGLWLSRKVGGFFCSENARTQALHTYREIALTLHRLNQVDLIEIRNGALTGGSNARRSIYGLLVALYAVNLSEIAESVFSTDEMVEIYLATALRMKATGKLSFLRGYYLRNAKHHHLLCTKENQKFDWAFSERGYQFISGSTEDSPSHREPIVHLQNEYCKHLLKEALQSLLGLKRNAEAKRSAHAAFQQSSTAEVAALTKHLIECTDEENSGVSDTVAWLARIVATAAQWRLSELENSEAQYVHTDRFPRSLVGAKTNEKTLFKALFVAFVARREFIHRKQSRTVDVANMQLIRNRCNVASVLLHDHVTCSRAQNFKKNSLVQLVQILTCEWLLETRTDCWEWTVECVERDEGISEPCWVSSVQLKEFQHDLGSMQLIVEDRSIGQSRVNMYEAIYRLMAAAAPLETHKLLERNIMQTRHSRSNLICVGKGNGDDDFVCGERERALSIYFACRFLPLQLGVERIGLLTQAAAIFKQIGDLDNMNRCYRLLNHSNQVEISNETKCK